VSKPAIFIRYRRSDTRWFAATLSTRMNQCLPGVDVFFDIASIEPGLDFENLVTSFFIYKSCGPGCCWQSVI
jgi:hypothetical protein